MRAFIPLNELSTHLGISTAEVEALVAAGELTGARVGGRLLFTQVDVDHFLKARGSKGIERPRAVKSWALPMAISMLLGASVVWAAFPGASTLEGLPVVVPYSGVLERNGAPISGPVTMRFALFNAETGGAPLWSSADEDVDVNAGRFSVNLGTPTPIPPRLFLDNPDVFLAVTVDGVTLDQRKALTPAPFALRAAFAAAADNFDVAGDLTADSAALNDLTVDTADVTDLTVGTAAVTGLTATTLSSNTFNTGTAGVSGALTAATVSATSMTATNVSGTNANFTQGNRHGNTTNGGVKVAGSQVEFRWGKGTSNVDGDQTFNFDIAFPTACVGVYLNRAVAGSANPFDATSCARASFILNRNDSTDGSEPFTYFAVGY